MREICSHLKIFDVEILIDTQLHALFLPEAKLGSIPQYKYYVPRQLSEGDLANITKMRRLAIKAMEQQESLGATSLLIPTVTVESFQSFQFPLVLALANATVESYRKKTSLPLLQTLVINESAFANEAGLDAALNLLSTLPVAGFYFVLNRSTREYPALLTANTLRNVMKFIYVLTVLNEFKLVCGYADVPGLAYIASGAHAIATGWHNSCRQHSNYKYRQSKGRQAKRRVTCQDILSPILIDDLQIAFDRKCIDLLIDDSPYLSPLRTGKPVESAWTKEDGTLQHWSVLSQVASDLKAHKPGIARLARLAMLLQIAETRIAEARTAGVVFDSRSGIGQIFELTKAVTDFRETLQNV